MLALLKCQYYSVIYNGVPENWQLALAEAAEGDYIMVKEKSTGKKTEEHYLNYDDADFDFEYTHDKWIMNGAELKGAIEFELFKVEEEI